MKINSSEYDALIIGGGPGGSTTAAILAEKGHRVLLLEKEKFPRYHVGESLMPFCYFSLERLGVLEELDKFGFTRKHSVQFASQDGKISTPFYFFQHFDHPSSTTWQVKRSEFDHMLLKNAAEKGAEIREETTVLNFLEEDDQVIGVTAHSEQLGEHKIYAKVTIDATGRDSLYQRKKKTRQRDPQLNKIAIWTYFKGAKRDPGLDEGATTIAYLEDKGWFWNIPMRDDVVSSGIVAERDYLYRDTRDPAEIFAREIKNNKWIDDHLSCGEQFGEYWVTGEYSYRAQHCADNGIVLVGDAFAFLDPVFSSGVFLALKSGIMAADSIDEALKRNDTSAAAFANYGETLCSHIETMRNIVYAFYNKRFNFGQVIKKYPELRPQLTDVLIGNIDDKDYTELMAAIGEFSDLPAPLPYGRAAEATVTA